MSAKLWFGVALLFATFGSVSASEPDIHLDLAASNKFPAFSVIPFVFEEGNLDCPDAGWTMTVLNGKLRIHQLNVPLELPPIIYPTYQMEIHPTDDFTYRLQYVRQSCHFDIDIRQQVRSDGEWKSLPVIEERRPSLSAQDRLQATQRRLSDLGFPLKQSKPLTQTDIDKTNEMLRSKRKPRWAASTMSIGFPFDAAPQSCIEVLGEYRFTKNSFALALFAPLPGGLNRVVMDGSDLDEAHGRIYLAHDDCRFEFTISQSLVRNGQPIPLPLRPLPDIRKAPVP